MTRTHFLSVVRHDRRQEVVLYVRVGNTRSTTNETPGFQVGSGRCSSVLVEIWVGSLEESLVESGDLGGEFCGEFGRKFGRE